MALDPRIALANQANQERRENQRLADIERRLMSLERQTSVVQVTSGAPSAQPKEGTLAADTAPRLWVRIGGAWHYVGLT
jgi:hypothetical protein